MKISKKVLTMVLAGVLAIGMTVPVYATNGPDASTDATAVTGNANGSTDIEVDGLVSLGAAVKQYKITWGSLTYTYTFGAWDTTSYSFAEGQWVAGGSSGDGTVTVLNQGSESFDVSATFTRDTGYAAFANVTGSLAKSGTIGTLSSGNSVTETLSLTGAPTANPITTSQRIGNITITIADPAN